MVFVGIGCLMMSDWYPSDLEIKYYLGDNHDPFRYFHCGGELRRCLVGHMDAIRYHCGVRCHVLGPYPHVWVPN